MLTLKRFIPTVLGVSCALIISFSSFAATENAIEIKQAVESNIQLTAETEIKKLVEDFNADTVKSLAVKIDVSNALSTDKKEQPSKTQTLIAE